MLKKIKISIFIVVIGLLPIASFGQNSSSSPFSMFGVGDLANSGFGRNRAMGGVSSPLISAYHINPANPASYIGMMPNTFLFEFGVTANSYKLSTPDDSFSKFDGNISYIAAGFPIAKWWKAGIGLRPLSSIGYNISQTETFDLDGSSVLQEYTGEGGINSFYFDNSFQILKPFSVGIKVAYIFGTLDRIKRTNNRINGFGTILTETNNSVFDAVSVGLGAHFHKMISENLFLNVGATFNFKTDLAAQYEKLIISEIRKTNYREFSDTLLYDPIPSGALILPQSYGIGASVLLNQKLELAGDYQVEKWSTSTFFGEKQNFTDNQRISAGFEYTPDYSSTKYLKIVRYRAGFNLTNSYLMVSDKQLKQVGGSVGLGLPLKSGAIINLSVLYNKRSIPGEDILTEDFFQFHLNLSLQSTWFIKRKFY